MQSRRLESAAGLKPMAEDQDLEQEIVFKNGVALSDTQIQDFKIMFQMFDANGSSTIETSEAPSVMKALGYDVPHEVVDFIVKDIDEDFSGEIDFDEFCTLMAKVLTPEGEVNVERYVTILKNEETRLKSIEMVPVLKDELTKHQRQLEEEHAKLATATQRLKHLESEYTVLANEVAKIRRGHDLSQQHWKGLSEGMREVRKTVAVPEGEGEMLPHANRLRSILPSLTPRPGSSLQP